MEEFCPAPALDIERWFNVDAPLTLNQLRGKIIFLHAFQMLCPGCVSHALPQAERVHRTFKGDEIAVIGLHSVFEHHESMSNTALQAFLHEYRITHPIAVDMHIANEATPSTMKKYSMRGTPTLILIDREGRFRYQEFGRIDDFHLGIMLGHLLAEDTPSKKTENCDAFGCQTKI